jgi:uncharacterized protein
MVKPVGPTCNLSCAYCYYLPKKQLYPGSRFRMSDELLELFTRQYIAAQRVPEVTFGWQGGEPTLIGLDFFRLAVRLQQKYRKPGMRVLNALQTNGTTLTDEWCDFFHENGFLVGLSLDGPAECHNAYRLDRRQQPTFDRVTVGAALLKKHDVQFNILTTVHAANADRPLEVYRFLRDDVGASFIQFIPIVERGNAFGFQEGTRVSDRSARGRQYGCFLNAVFDEWVRRDIGRVFVQIFDVALAAWMGERPGLCVFDETCGTALIVEHNGDVYACDHFVEPNWLLGNLTEYPLVDLVGSEKQRRFGLDKRDALPQVCVECPVRFVCNGACPKNRVLRAPNGEPGLSYLCEGYKAFFAHIRRPMDLMVAELREGRPPATVMGRLVAEDVELERQIARAGRNDPCPCGSGMKFKNCHGRASRRTAGHD